MGSQKFWGASLAQTPANFGPKLSCVRDATRRTQVVSR